MRPGKDNAWLRVRHKDPAADSARGAAAYHAEAFHSAPVDLPSPPATAHPSCMRRLCIVNSLYQASPDLNSGFGVASFPNLHCKLDFVGMICYRRITSSAGDCTTHRANPLAQLHARSPLQHRVPDAANRKFYFPNVWHGITTSLALNLTINITRSRQQIHFLLTISKRRTYQEDSGCRGQVLAY